MDREYCFLHQYTTTSDGTPFLKTLRVLLKSQDRDNLANTAPEPGAAIGDVAAAGGAAQAYAS
jgi:hypothetical protein